MNHNDIGKCLMAVAFVVGITAGELSAAADVVQKPTGATAQMEFESGHFREAIADLQAETDRCQQQGDLIGSSKALSQIAVCEEQLGNYPAAIDAFTSALNRDTKDSLRRDQLKVSLAQAYVLARSDTMGMSYLDKVRPLLNEVDAAPEAKQDSAIRFMSSNVRASLILVEHPPKMEQPGPSQPLLAAKAYETSVLIAESTNKPAWIAQAAANAGVAYLVEARAAKYDVDLARLKSAIGLGRAMNDKAWNAAAAADLPTTHETAFLFLTIGQTDDGFDDLEPSNGSKRLRAFAAYQQAEKIADKIDDPVARTYAFGYKAHLYELERGHDEATYWNRKALLIAQKLQMPDPLYLWQEQSGRLQADSNDTEGAIAAYQESEASLRSIETDVSAGGGNGSGSISFQQTAGDVYYPLADLLLRRAEHEEAQNQPDKVKDDLNDARDTVELLKRSELENYLQERCQKLLAEKSVKVEDLDRHSAVVYFVPLKDRVVILVGVSKGKNDSYIRQFVTKVSSDELNSVVRPFRSEVRNTSKEAYFAHGQKLYEWLIEPIEPYLDARGKKNADDTIDTLVFVPDVSLSSVPMAALADKDGKFLIEKYAVAISPGLQLTTQQEAGSQSDDTRLLINGLSKLPPGFSNYSDLPGVDDEIKGINAEFPGQGMTLLNKQFLRDRVDSELQSTPYSIVHIASHGHFGDTKQDTFILTYDPNQPLDLDELERLIEPSKFRNRPIDLLTLSACETAAGDDRAALGMAGVAVKAGALSAFASLWSINDQSTAFIIREFYKNLHQTHPRLSKAQALQMAQIKLMKEHPHPYFWSPYLIVGNWL